jgi:exodeoxyribonuclease VII small subunit
MARLEKIVAKLEKGDASLDESIALFEEGTKLAAECSKTLDQAEQSVVRLTKGADGEPQEHPMELQL